MKNVGLYVRVSTQEQAEKGWSIEGQIAELYKFCDGHAEWKVRWVLKDPGYTAANLERPGIHRLLELVQEGRVDIIVVWRYDRLSRDNLDFPLLLHIFRRHNADVVSATEPAPGTDTPYGEFVVGMIGLMATLERKMIAMRVRLGLRTRAKRGLWHGGPVPYGYAYDKGTGRLVRNEAEASVVRLAFDTYARIGRIYGLRGDLQRDGIVNRHGKPWGVPALRTMLGHRLYTGTLALGGVEVEDASLAIVPRELFERCHQTLEEERERNRDPVRSDAVVHAHVNKEAFPACPRCGTRQTVRRHGVFVLANGCVRRRYWCRACRKEFRDATADLAIPPCPACGLKDEIQYFNIRTSPDGLPFHLFGCRRCQTRFRVLVRDEPLGGAAVRAVRAGADELEPAPTAPLPLGDA